MTQKQATAADLKDMVRLLDNHAQDGFNAIAAAASLALLALESPTGHFPFQNITGALALIRERAELSRDIITSEAESVGCHWVDEAGARRTSAFTSIAAKAVGRAAAGNGLNNRI